MVRTVARWSRCRDFGAGPRSGRGSCLQRALRGYTRSGLSIGQSSNTSGSLSPVWPDGEARGGVHWSGSNGIPYTLPARNLRRRTALECGADNDRPAPLSFFVPLSWCPRKMRLLRHFVPSREFPLRPARKRIAVSDAVCYSGARRICMIHKIHGAGT
jgi:hypothetical protein